MDGAWRETKSVRYLSITDPAPPEFHHLHHHFEVHLPPDNFKTGVTLDHIPARVPETNTPLPKACFTAQCRIGSHGLFFAEDRPEITDQAACSVVSGGFLRVHFLDRISVWTLFRYREINAETPILDRLKIKPEVIYTALSTTPLETCGSG